MLSAKFLETNDEVLYVVQNAEVAVRTFFFFLSPVNGHASRVCVFSAFVRMHALLNLAFSS